MKPLILVVDDQPSWRLRADVILRDDYQVDFAGTYDAAIKMLKEERPPYHVLIADIRLTDGDPGDTSGLDIVQYAEELGGNTSVVIWTAFPAIDTAKIAFRDLDAVDYVEKSFVFDDDAFRSLVKQAAEVANQKRWPRRALLVDSDAGWRERLSGLFENAECSTIRVDTFSHALELARHGEFRLVVVDIALEDDLGNKGLDFISEIGEISPESKVVIVTDGGNMATVRDAFVNLGVVDYLLKTNSGVFDSAALLKVVNEVYRPSNQLFIVAELRYPETDGMLIKDHQYVFVISARERLLRIDQSTTPIWLPPWKSRVEIEVVVDVDDGEDRARIMPTPSQTWVVSRELSSINFTIVPTETGVLHLQAELFGEGNWWRRIPSQNFTVR